MKFKNLFKLDPAPSDGGSSAPSAGNKVGGVVPVVPSNTTPQEALGMSFDVEQLPGDLVDDTSQQDVALKGSEIADPKKPEPKEQKSSEQQEVIAEEGKEEKPKEEGEYSNLPKGLKPPKKDEQKKDEKGKDAKDKGVDLEKKIEPSTKEGQFDYSGYSPSEVIALKNMSVQSRKFVSDMIKQNRELKKTSEAVYYQHPQGYILSPEFGQLQVDSQHTQYESRHWEAQLKNLKEGKKVKDFAGWDPKTGQPVFGQEMEPSDQLEEAVRHALQQTYNLRKDLDTKVKEFPKKYKDFVTNGDQAVAAESAKRFAWVSDPKMMDCMVTVKGFGDKSLSTIKKDLISILPGHLRSHPMTELASNFFITMAIQGAELQELRDELANSKLTQQETRRAEPSSSDKPSKPKIEVHGIKEFVYDESQFN